MKSILIASADLGEVPVLQGALQGVYAVSVISSPAQYAPDRQTWDAILLDTSFTPYQGVDFLVKIRAHSHIRVIVLTPVDDPQGAVEALRAGAYNYLIKTGDYGALVSSVIDEAMRRFEDREELKRTIISLKQRCAELERQLKSGGKTAPAGAYRPAADKYKKRLLEEITARLRQGEINLPPYPQIAIKLRRLIKHQASIAQITDLLRDDAAVAAKLIRMSNSPYYRGVNDTRTLEQAISRLGLKETAIHTEAIANRALYTTSKKRYQAPLKELWLHAMACAHASSLVAARLRTRAREEMFVMGLLHDVGKLVLIQLVAEMEASGVDAEATEGKALYDFLTAHHARFGEFILARWQFPPAYGVIAIRHERLDTAGQPPWEVLVVNFANLLVASMGWGMGQAQEEVDLANTPSALRLQLSPAVIDEIQRELDAIVRSSIEHLG